MSAQNVPSGEGQGEMSLFAGLVVYSVDSAIQFFNNKGRNKLRLNALLHVTAEIVSRYSMSV